MLAASCLIEEGGEGVVFVFLVGHPTIRLDTMLQAVQLPAGIAHLDTSLPHMDGDTFTLEQRPEDVDRALIGKTVH